MKDGITAMLEERIANVIHEERMMRSVLLSFEEGELDARGHGNSAARKAQASCFQRETRTPSQYSKASELDTASNTSDSSLQLPRERKRLDA